MRVTYITPGYPPGLGGVETHVHQLATRAAAAGYDTGVLTHRLKRTLAGHDWDCGVEIERFLSIVPNAAFAFAPRMWGQIARRGPRLGLVHVHAYHSVAALGAALRKRFPLVFTPHYHGTGHSPLRAALHPAYRRVGRLLFDRADAIICVSRAEARLVAEHFPGCEQRIVVIPNGADVAAIDAAQPFERDRTVILSAGRLEDYKHVEKTVSAMADLDQGFELIITGDGPARDTLERLADELQLSDRVGFRGRVSDEELKRWLRTAAVFVTMSSNEASSIVSLEALRGGCRVVASDIAAHREVATVTRGTIELVPPGIEPARLAAHLQAISRRPVATPRVSSWDDVADATLELYERVRAGADPVRQA